jgi:DNA ligase-1
MLYKIIKSLQDAQGSLAKQAILDANKDDVLLKNFMKAVYDPAINYWQAKVPEVAAGNVASFDQELLNWLDETLAQRKVTGKTSIAFLKQVNACLDIGGQELLKLVFNRKIGASVGDTMVLKTWPDLYFIPPYQRCSLMDDKIKAKFDSLDSFFIQKKCDGSFLYLVVSPEKPPEAITRAGSKYPTWVAERLSVGLETLSEATVFVGELEVFRIGTKHDGNTETLLPRQEGNGLLNAALKGREEEEFFDYSFKLTAWDILDEVAFKDGLSPYKYSARLKDLEETIEEFDPPYVEAIETQKVTNLEDAYKIYSSFTAQGMEGAVIKNPSALWKNGTSRDIVKLKIAFEADYIVTAVLEGNGKAAGMMGAISITTSDGRLRCDVGTGFLDDVRKDWWASREVKVGTIVTIIANDVISKRTDDIHSLFLPVFSDERFDKSEADSLEQVMAQLNNAKGL